jgi:hypothetical protein
MFLVVVGVVGYFAKDYIRDHQGGMSIDRLISTSPEQSAETRVDKILEHLKNEGDIEEQGLQAAICLWDSDKIVLQDRNELEAAYDAFNAWRDEFGINQRKISDYTITGSELTQKTPPVVTVSGTIEGRSFKMRVPDERRISWM